MAATTPRPPDPTGYGTAGAVDPRLEDLTDEDRRVIWRVATVMLDVTRLYAVDVATFVMEKLGNLPRDADMVAALEDHANADAREVLVTLRSGMDPSAHETPVEAIRHARYLRQRGIGLGTLIDVYKYGFAMFRELVREEFRRACSDERRLAKVMGAVDAYSFPFVQRTLQRLAYEFGSMDSWEPHAEDPILADSECAARAEALRDREVAAGHWTAADPESSGARANAQEQLNTFSDDLASGVDAHGMHERLAGAKTSIAITLADQDDLTICLMLDRAPIEIVDGIVDTEARIWMPSVDVVRMWSPDFYLPMAIAKGRIRAEGPVRKFLRILPVLRSLGTEQIASSFDRQPDQLSL